MRCKGADGSPFASDRPNQLHHEKRLIEIWHFLKTARWLLPVAFGQMNRLEGNHSLCRQARTAGRYVSTIAETGRTKGGESGRWLVSVHYQF